MLFRQNLHFTFLSSWIGAANGRPSPWANETLISPSIGCRWALIR
jgi:hypothetical protein